MDHFQGNIWFFLLLNFFKCFIYFWQRERQSMRRGRGRERGRHRIRSRLRALSCQPRARRGAQTHGPRDHDLSWSPTLNWLSHPGALRNWIFKNFTLLKFKQPLEAGGYYIHIGTKHFHRPPKFPCDAVNLPSTSGKTTDLLFCH